MILSVNVYKNLSRSKNFRFFVVDDETVDRSSIGEFSSTFVGGKRAADSS